jgi:hypothetical protein
MMAMNMDPRALMMLMGVQNAASVLSGGQPQMGLQDVYRLQAFQQQQKRQQAQDVARSKLMGGHDPQTGITWNQGRPAGMMDDSERTGLMFQAAPDAMLGAMAKQMLASPKERRIVKGADGLNYYADTSERVLPGVQPSAKPPATRTVKQGDKTYTEEWDANEGVYKRIAEAPRYKPGEVNVAPTDLSPITNLLGKAGRRKEILALRDMEAGTVKIVNQGTTLAQQLLDSGDQAISWSGALARGADTLVSQGRAIARNFGINTDEGVLKRLNTDDWEWGAIATESGEIKSRILGLAVALTKEDQGSRPSDFDVQTSINQLAGAAGNAKRMAHTIMSMVERKMSDFSIHYNTLAPDYGEALPHTFDWPATLERHGIVMPAIDEPGLKPDEWTDMSDEEFKRRFLE